MCRDMLSLITKQLENKNFSIDFKLIISDDEEVYASIAFTDDIGLVEEGPVAVINAQEMIIEYENLCDAVGIKLIQINKNYKA